MDTLVIMKGVALKLGVFITSLLLGLSIGQGLKSGNIMDANETVFTSTHATMETINPDTEGDVTLTSVVIDNL
mgnify:CR=1 FL=1